LIPKTIIKGMVKYFITAFIAIFLGNILLSGVIYNLEINNVIVLWILDGTLWLAAIIFLLDGFKYQASEKDILRDLADMFKLNNRVNSDG